MRQTSCFCGMDGFWEMDRKLVCASGADKGEKSVRSSAIGHIHTAHLHVHDHGWGSLQGELSDIHV